MAALALNDRGYERLRQRLVETIRATGIDDPRVLDAFAAVPRHLFIPDAVRRYAYEDVALPIGWGQTSSQPSLQALYAQVLGIRATDRVLEIGTGTGYQTAVLSHLAAQVFSIERIPEMSGRARSILDGLSMTGVVLLIGDGSLGWPRFAPWDAVLVAAAAPAIPSALVDQLATGGRMLIPVGDLSEQRLTLVTKRNAGVETEEIIGCSFVPLVGRQGWNETT
ncbi:MAG: protein-L-isoaspartate(D-aspartate) O-methyltransferase [Gemmatimonadetes bacterium]|nr:protein-L-isoaspartate(D-aspartate) O-methyltransferase [Gemmatimonadota bacterium]